jgi:membrane associated rhomboid family serine protease
LTYALAFVPARYTGGLDFGISGVVSPFTHMFLHGGWMHLGVNVLSLAAFGAGLEKWLGARKFLAVYFLSGLTGALCELLWMPRLEAPMIGASGGISGLFGALLVVMYGKGYMGQGSGMQRLLPFVLIWLATTVFFGWFGVPGTGGAAIAWQTHVGGFLAGMMLAKVMARV